MRSNISVRQSSMGRYCSLAIHKQFQPIAKTWLLWPGASGQSRNAALWVQIKGLPPIRSAPITCSRSSRCEPQRRSHSRRHRRLAALRHPTRGTHHIVVSDVMNRTSKRRNGFARSDNLRSPCRKCRPYRRSGRRQRFRQFRRRHRGPSSPINDANCCLRPYFMEDHIYLRFQQTLS